MHLLLAFSFSCYVSLKFRIYAFGFYGLGLLGTGFYDSKDKDTGSSDLNLEELSLSLRSKVIATPKVRYFFILYGLFLFPVISSSYIYVMLAVFFG